MGIYIKGMEMPEKIEPGLVIEFAKGIDGKRYARLHHYQYGGLTDWLEAFPVPPHGRLIDADKLGIRDAEKQAYEAYLRERGEDFIEEPLLEYLRGRSEGLTQASGYVRFAPTIIPAEEGE